MEEKVGEFTSLVGRAIPLSTKSPEHEQAFWIGDSAEVVRWSGIWREVSKKRLDGIEGEGRRSGVSSQQ